MNRVPLETYNGWSTMQQATQRNDEHNDFQKENSNAYPQITRTIPQNEIAEAKQRKVVCIKED